MKLSVYFTTLMCIISLIGEVPARAGNDGHGGDTDAVEFVGYALNIGQWLKTVARPELKSNKFINYAQMLAKNLDGNEKAKLEFVDYKLEDEFGTPKMALYSSIDQPIQINRKVWEHLTEQKKYELVSLEIFGQIGVKERYVRAATIATHYTEMESANRYEIQKALEDFTHFKLAPVSVDVFGGYSDVLDAVGLHSINEQVKKQELHSGEPSDIPKLAQLFSKPRYACESQIILAMHRIVFNDPIKIEEIIETLHQDNLKEVEQLKKFKIETEAKGYKYYGGDTTPSSKSVYAQLNVSLDAKYDQQIHAFLVKWDQTKGADERQALLASFKVDIFKEPSEGIRVNGALYRNKHHFWGQETNTETGRTEDLGTPFHWDFDNPNVFWHTQYAKTLVNIGFQSADEEEQRCTMTGAQLAYTMGIQWSDVEAGFRPAQE